MRTKTPQQADKMLEAAARLFASQLFHNVRMEDIAKEASVGKGTLYRYFADKEELFLALLERASNQFLACARMAFETDGDHRQKLIAFVTAGIRFFDERPHLAPLIQRAEVTCGQDSPWQPTRSQVMQWILELFAGASRVREFRFNEPQIAVFMLIGGLRNIAFFAPKPRTDGLAEQIIDTFLQGAAA